MGSVVIIGGGPIGLATGMLLEAAGLDVTVLEKDAASPPSTPDEAWESWLRAGVAQFHQAHTLLPRGHHILSSRLPRVIENLESLGAHKFSVMHPIPPSLTDWSEPQDTSRFESLGARRPIYELAFALAAAETGLDVRRGVTVTGLRMGASVLAGVPHVAGVETATGPIEADLVLDVSGRRSSLPALLEAQGARRPAEVTEDSRFVYYSRFYRKRDSGHFPAGYGIALMPVGSISVLMLPGDNDTWSVTLYSTTADKPMRAVRDSAVFDRVVRAIPPVADWIDAHPITDVDVMAGVSDRERWMVVDEIPVATGVLPLSDAWACTNPSAGRGISMALLHVESTLPGIWNSSTARSISSNPG